jgi:hypothetical protein
MNTDFSYQRISAQSACRPGDQRSIPYKPAFQIKNRTQITLIWQMNTDFSYQRISAQSARRPGDQRSIPY